MKFSILTIVFFLFSFFLFGEKVNDDNISDLRRSKGFDATIDSYINLIKENVKKEPDSSLFFNSQVEDFAKELNHKLSDGVKSKLKFYKGVAKYNLGQYIEGRHYLEQSLKIVHLDSLDGERYFYLALNHKKVGNYTESVENFIRAATIFEQSNKQKARVSAYINLSNVLMRTKQHEKSLEYCSEALKLAEKHNLSELNRIIYTTWGNVFLDMKDYQLALDNFNQSYQESKKIGNIYGQFVTLINIAGAKRMLGNRADALSHLQDAFLLSDSLNNTSLKGKIYYELGEFFAQMSNKKESEFYLKESLKIAETSNNRPDIKDIYQSYRILYENLGDYKKSLNFFKKFEKIKDEIMESQNASKVTQLSSQFQLDRKEKELKLMAKDKELKESQNERNRIFIYLLIGLGVLLLVLVLALTMISIIRSKRNEVLKEKNDELEDKKSEIESQNHELETFNDKLENTNNALHNKNVEIETQKEKLQSQRDLLNLTHEQLKVRNKDVTDSIHYAQKIQQAMLNSSFHIDGSGVDYFTFYKPRDIVSGDFYWSNVVGDELIVAIGDCTGHGVPGAFMSCLGISLLNEIVFGREIVQPHSILEDLRSSVIQLIATDKNAELQIGDGMDIAIISLNLKTNYLKFSGAMNGLAIVSDNCLEEVKGDKNPIGQHIIPNHKFTLIEKQLKTGDLIYATTDGYKDQFGGPKGKKLGKRRLQEKLLEISQLSVPVQKVEVIKFYKSWRMHEEQIDDVCLFGMKVAQA